MVRTTNVVGVVFAIAMLGGNAFAGWTAIKEKSKKVGQSIKNGAQNVAQGTKEIVRVVREDVPYLIDQKRHNAENVNLVLAAFGDSITSAVNATTPFNRALDVIPFDHRFNINPIIHESLSWATGSKDVVDSHLLRLRRKFPQLVVKGINVAKPMAVAEALPGQVDLVLTHYAPNYVNIMMGANDVCQRAGDLEADAKAFEKNYVTAIDKLLAKRLGTKILIVGIPPVEKVFNLGRTYKGCEPSWKLFKFCRGLTSPDATADERFAVIKRWERFNEVLQKIADRYPQNVKLSTSVVKANLQDDHISFDCFHPSTKGQASLAEITWEEGWEK